MARRLFPLVDVVIGTPTQGLQLGAAALLPHGLTVDLFLDEACTTAADCRAVGDDGYADEAVPLSSVSIVGAALPRFYGPDDDAVLTLWGLVSGRPASEAFPVRATGIAGPEGPAGPQGPTGAAVPRR